MSRRTLPASGGPRRGFAGVVPPSPQKFKVREMLMARHPLFGSTLAVVLELKEGDVVFEFEGDNVVLLPAAYPASTSMVLPEWRAAPFFNRSELVDASVYEGAKEAFFLKNEKRIDGASFDAAWRAATGTTAGDAALSRPLAPTPSPKKFKVREMLMAKHLTFGWVLAVVLDLEEGQVFKNSEYENVVLLPAEYPAKLSKVFPEWQAERFFMENEPVNKSVYKGAALAFLEKNKDRIDEASFMAAWEAAKPA